MVGFGRDRCGKLEAAEQRERLVTNGIGGFASGTVAGLLTRRYRGLLVAALKPPLGRPLLVSKIEEIAAYDGRNYPLDTNRWAGGTGDPQGYRNIEAFRLDGTTPVWTFACAEALIEKRVWMQRGANTTYHQFLLHVPGKRNAISNTTQLPEPAGGRARESWRLAPGNLSSVRRKRRADCRR